MGTGQEKSVGRSGVFFAKEIGSVLKKKKTRENGNPGIEEGDFCFFYSLSGAIFCRKAHIVYSQCFSRFTVSKMMLIRSDR